MGGKWLEGNNPIWREGNRMSFIQQMALSDGKILEDGLAMNKLLFRALHAVGKFGINHPELKEDLYIWVKASFKRMEEEAEAKSPQR